MHSQYPHEQRTGRVGAMFRSVVERVARLLLDEPFVLVPQRQAERLRQLERREELQMAERRGDHAFLDRELENVQPTSEHLAGAANKVTPIHSWPDEKFDDCFDKSPDSQEQSGTAI